MFHSNPLCLKNCPDYPAIEYVIVFGILIGLCILVAAAFWYFVS